MGRISKNKPQASVGFSAASDAASLQYVLEGYLDFFPPVDNAADILSPIL